MSWPTPSDYQEAIQNPKLSFSDPILKNGKPLTDNLGLPRAISGTFAIVFPIECDGKIYAVRCFQIESYEREKKYFIVTNYLKKINLKYMVEFEYIENGIKIRNNWYPILKMEWIEGIHLNDYIKINLNDKNKLNQLANNFLEMIKELNVHKIAHGDLHHQNILIKNDEFKLIDYDAMFVPGLEGMICGEVGHRNYQHPLRNEVDFGPYLDNFSAWEIYISINVLSFDNKYWSISGAGEECILFRKEDFYDTNSKLFIALQSIQDDTIKGLISEFQSIIYTSVLSDIPCINEKEIENSKMMNYDPSISSEISNIEHGEWIFEHLPVKQLSLSKNIKKERIFTTVFIILTLCNIYFIYQNYYTFILGFGISLCGILLISNFYLSSYNKIPIVIEKKILQENKKSSKIDVDVINNQIKTLKNKITEITTIESKSIIRINDNIIQNKKDEREYLMNVDNNLANQLKKLASDYAKTDKDETEEINIYTTNFKHQYIYMQLNKHKISHASISGLGPALTSRLTAYGFTTAADILDFNIQISRYGDNIANIKSRSGGWYHINGIGPKTLENIKNWHQGLKGKYEHTTPSPPTEEIMKIKSKYTNKKNSINKNRSDLKNQNINLKNTKVQYYRQINDNLSRQIQKIKLEKIQEKRKYLDEIKEQERRLVSVNWKYSELLYKLSSYKNVTLWNYLKKIL